MISGPFPTEMGNLKSLRSFWGYDNAHTGQIPSELGNIPNLEIFNVAINDLSGSLPPELGSAELLYRLRFFGNPRMTGTIPSEISSLPFLEDIWAGSTGIGGPFPSTFHVNSSLTAIAVDGNPFTGTVPSSVYSLPNLRNLEIMNTEMTGAPIPNVLLADFTGTITKLAFNGNAFTGTIPSAIGAFQSLQQLILNNNHFVGALPEEVGALQDLTELQIQGNMFTSVPDGICDLRGEGDEEGEEALFLETYISDCEDVGCTCCTACGAQTDED